MYVSLEQIKQHLNINPEFEGDDLYLMELEEVAEASVSIHIDRPIDELADEEGDIPSPLRHAILIFIANQYANRESISYTSITEVPVSFNFLCDQYRNYYNGNTCNCQNQ